MNGLRNTIDRYMKNKTIMSFAGIAAGIVLMIWRGKLAEGMIRLVGYVLIAAAVAYLVMYFRGNKQNETFLGYAIMAGIAGLLFIILCRMILNIFPIIVGVLMVINGVTALQQTLHDQTVPLYSKILSGVVILIGILIAIHPGAIADTIVFCIGAAFVVNGVSGLLGNRRI